MRKGWMIALIVAILVVGGILARNAVGNRNSFNEVKTATVELGDIQSYLSTTAVIKSRDSKEYYSIQGRVKEVHVKVGEQVEIGDLLVTYEVQDLTMALRQAEIQQSNAVLQRQELINQNNQIKDKIAELDEEIKRLKESNDPMEQAKSEALKQQKNSLQPISTERLKQADNAVELAKLSVDSAKERILDNKDRIVAENRGVVTEITVVAGGIGGSPQPAIVVQDIENLKAEASVGRYDANVVSVGQAARIRNGNEVYKGEVSFVNPVARRTVSTAGNETLLGIEIAILEEARNLRIDFGVDIDILVGEESNAVKVPAESIRKERDRYYVFVVENQRAREREITIGLQSDMEAQVLEGLQAGETIILNPRATIRDGSPVVEEAGGRRR